MICDSHVHVGKFYDNYTSPKQLIELIKPFNLNRYAVSSTTICDENYSKVLNEIEYLLIHDDKRVDPVLWVTSQLINDDKNLNEFLTSGFPWKCIKIHPLNHPEVWIKNSDIFQLVITIAEELYLPILIHTGGHPNADIGIWDSILPLYPEQTFIFAHCRPFDQAIPLLQSHQNAYGDLAFVDESVFTRLISENIWEKILWGSDIPINEYFLKDISTKDYYNQRLEKLKNASYEEQYSRILFENYCKLFKI